MRQKHLFLLLMASLLFPHSGLAAPTPLPRASFLAERASAQQALRRLDPTGALKVHWPPHRPRPIALLGLQIKIPGATPEDQARKLLQDYQALFLAPGATLKLQDVQRTRNRQVIRFQQFFEGLKVEGSRVAVKLDHGGQIRTVNSITSSVEKISTTPRVSAPAAVSAVLSMLQKVSASPGKKSWTRLIILAEGSPRLVYQVNLPLRLDRQGRSHLVDAVTGKYLGWRRGAIIERSPLSRKGGAR